MREKKYKSIPINATIFCIVCGLVAMFGVYWIFNYLLYPKLNLNLSRAIFDSISYIILYCIGFPLLYLFIRNIPKQNIEIKKSIEIKSLFKILIIQCGISVLVMFIVSLTLNSCTSNIYPTFINIRDPYEMIKLLIIAPVLEELVFRKVLLDRLRPYGNLKSILISSLFFSIPHFVSQGIPQIFYTLILGCIWAYVMNKTGKIKYTIFLHGFSNLWAGIIPMILLKSSAGSLLYFVLWIIIIPMISILIIIFNRSIITDILYDKR